MLQRTPCPANMYHSKATRVNWSESTRCPRPSRTQIYSRLTTIPPIISPGKLVEYLYLEENKFGYGFDTTHCEILSFIDFFCHFGKAVWSLEFRHSIGNISSSNIENEIRNWRTEDLVTRFSLPIFFDIKQETKKIYNLCVHDGTQ